MKLKVFTTGNGGMTRATISAAIGVDTWVRQISVIIVAPSKAEAVDIMARERLGFTSDLRMLTRWPLGDSIRDFAAGVPGAYVCALTPHRGQRIAEVRSGVIRVVGVVGMDSDHCQCINPT